MNRRYLYEFKGKIFIYSTNCVKQRLNHNAKIDMTIPNRLALIDIAIEQTGLNDFGDTWFFANIDALIPALNDEAKLSPEGEYGAQGMIVGALSSRLRHVDLVKSHPEILQESVNVKAVLTGLPRTGSTMLHRMIAAAPGLTAVRWYETQNYVPLPGETPGDPAPRRAAAEGILGYMLEKIPELMSIHPMSIEQPDEEVIILGQLFSSSMIESTYFVPSYAKWLSCQDARTAYADLVQILQSLQWQDQSRAGKSWVLKTPGHLMALDTVLDVFPDAKVVMTHRDPISTVPSYCSMEASLYKMGSDRIENDAIGAYWNERLGEWLDGFMAVRNEADASRFVDVAYTNLTQSPTEEGARVLEETGIAMSQSIKDGMQDWIEANRREHRAAHKYTLEDFGLTASDIENRFSGYRAKYLG